MKRTLNIILCVLILLSSMTIDNNNGIGTFSAIIILVSLLGLYLNNKEDFI